MDLFVREVCVDDAAAIVAIMNPIIAAGVYTAFDTPFTIESEEAYIKNLSERAIFHVAIDRITQRVVGFQSMDPFATYTQAFAHVGVVGTYVDLACRRQGIATALFKATFEAARRKGYEKLFTFVRADNPSALATYLTHGFTIVGTARQHAKINGTYIDETIIERAL